jgi:hypothetical protein
MKYCRFLAVFLLQFYWSNAMGKIFESTPTKTTSFCWCRNYIYTLALLSGTFIDGAIPAKAYTVLDWKTDIGEIITIAGNPFTYVGNLFAYGPVTGTSGLTPGHAWASARYFLDNYDYFAYSEYGYELIETYIYESFDIDVFDPRINNSSKLITIPLNSANFAGSYTFEYRYDHFWNCYDPSTSYCGEVITGGWGGGYFNASQLTISEVPEPSTGSMMILGCAGLGLVGSSRLKKRTATLRAMGSDKSPTSPAGQSHFSSRSLRSFSQ